MKKITLILLLSASINLSFSQEPVSNEYVVATSDRSTVYIINNPIGKLIYDSWIVDPTYDGFEPTVILVDDLRKYRIRVNKKQKNNNYDNRTSTKRKEQKGS